MKKKPFISVVIPTYNRVNDLRKAIASVRRQKFDDFEILISDNQSNDETQQYVNDMHDNRLRYVRTPRHMLVQQHIQFAISKALGKYIFLLGDDDVVINPKLLSSLTLMLKKHAYGLLRLNYVSLSPDKRSVFDFRASKHFVNDANLPANVAAPTIIQFIEHMDASFMSGLVFLNALPKNVRILQSELNCWFPVLFWAAKEHGACYISTPSILASWSRWRPTKNRRHSLYSMVEGRLSGERFYDEVKKYLSSDAYEQFLSAKIFGTYVQMFPAVKYFTGSRNLLQLARRCISLAPNLRGSIIYWVYLLVSLIIPAYIWGIIRKWMLQKKVREMAVHTKEVVVGLKYYHSL